MEAEEAVGENAALEERAQLTLDEARDAPLLDARVAEPGLQVMLDHPIESGRLGAARDVSGCSSYLSRFSHEAIVVSSAYRRHVAKGIAFPPHNGCVSVTAWMPSGRARTPRSKMAPNGGALQRTPVHSRAQREAS